VSPARRSWAPDHQPRLLIVRTGALGDIVHALPVLAALRSTYPTAIIDWVVDARYAPLLDLVQGLTHRIVVRAAAGGAAVGERRFAGNAGFAAAVRHLRAQHYDVAFDLQGLLKSAVLARLSGARRVVGYVREQLREPAAAWWYKERIAAPERGHVIVKNLAALDALGIETRAVAFPWAPFRSHVAETVAANPVVQGAGGYVLMNPGAAWPNKRWSPERFGALAARLAAVHGLPSIVLWGPGEHDLATAVAASSRDCARPSPRTGLADVLALAAGARLVVSGDTGPLHLAASVGAPLVALFGPTRPERNGPWLPVDGVVSRAATCVCFHKRQCTRGRACIDEIPVDEVLEACTRRLSVGQSA
jgi:lipopolysaccharide heptosyltransferase I